MMNDEPSIIELMNNPSLTRDWGPSRMAPIWAREHAIRLLAIGITEAARTAESALRLCWMCFRDQHGDHRHQGYNADGDCVCECHEDER